MHLVIKTLSKQFILKVLYDLQWLLVLHFPLVWLEPQRNRDKIFEVVYQQEDKDMQNIKTDHDVLLCGDDYTWRISSIVLEILNSRLGSKRTAGGLVFFL